MKANQPSIKSLIKSHGLFIIISIFLVMTTTIFAPIEMYLSNKQNFWFGISDITPVIFSLAIILIIIVSLVYILLVKFLPKYKDVYTITLFGISLACYWQGNFSVTNYGLLDGSYIDWDSLKVTGIINIIVWTIFILVPIFVLIIKPKVCKKSTIFVSGLLTGMQLVTILTLLFTTNINSTNFFVSSEKMFDMSPESNIVTFVLDTFDGKTLTDVLNKYPEKKQSFKDFTYFDNTIGAGTYTLPSMYYLLAGEYYDNSAPINEKRFDDMSDAPLYKSLAENNYSVEVMTDTTHLSLRDSAIISNIKEDESIPTSRIDLTARLYKLAAFRYAPHYFKENLVVYSGEFNYFQDKDVVYTNDNRTFYERLVDNGLNLNNPQNTYKLYHLFGVHPPYSIDENVNATSDTNIDKVALGSLKIVEDYIAELKRLGIYDNTTIIVMADHGDYRDIGQNPMLMVKRQNDSKEFSVSKAPVSFENFHPTIISEIGGNYSDVGRTFFEVAEDEIIERKFYHFSTTENAKDGSEYLSDLTEYSIMGDVNDVLNIRKTGNIYTKNGLIKNEIPTYKIGDEVILGNDGKELDYYTTSVTKEVNLPAWIIGNKAGMKMKLDNYNNTPLKLDLYVGAVANGKEQTMKLYSGSKLIGETLINTKDVVSFLIPAEAIVNNILELEMQFSNSEIWENRPSYGHNQVRSVNLYKFRLHEVVDTESFEEHSRFEFPLVDNVENFEEVIVNENLKLTLYSGLALKQEDERFLIDGATYIEGLYTKDQKVYVEFTSDTGEIKTFRATSSFFRFANNDISPDYNNAGFFLRLSEADLPEGDLKMRVIIDNNGIHTHEKYIEYFS